MSIRRVQPDISATAGQVNRVLIAKIGRVTRFHGLGKIITISKEVRISGVEISRTLLGLLYQFKTAFDHTKAFHQNALFRQSLGLISFASSSKVCPWKRLSSNTYLSVRPKEI